MDPDDLKKKDPPKSKNQKRNENRRLRKEEGGGDEVAALADKVAAAKVDEAPAAAPAPEDPKDVLSKKVNVAGKYYIVWPLSCTLVALPPSGSVGSLLLPKKFPAWVWIRLSFYACVYVCMTLSLSVFVSVCLSVCVHVCFLYLCVLKLNCSHCRVCTHNIIDLCLHRNRFATSRKR
jgi:hypothetical protein